MAISSRVPLWPGWGPVSVTMGGGGAGAVEGATDGVEGGPPPFGAWWSLTLLVS